MSQKGCGFPNAPYPYRGSPGALGWGLGLVQALSRHPASSTPWQCSGPPSLHLLPGESNCHRSCSTGVLESVNWAGCPAPGPTVSRNELARERTSLVREPGQALVSSTGERVQEARLGLGAVGTCFSVVCTPPASVRWGRGVDPRPQDSW